MARKRHGGGAKRVGRGNSGEERGTATFWATHEGLRVDWRPAGGHDGKREERPAAGRQKRNGCFTEHTAREFAVYEAREKALDAECGYTHPEAEMGDVEGYAGDGIGLQTEEEGRAAGW